MLIWRGWSSKEFSWKSADRLQRSSSFFLLSPERLSSVYDKEAIEKIIPMKYDGFREYKRRTYAQIGMPKL